MNLIRFVLLLIIFNLQFSRCYAFTFRQAVCSQESYKQRKTGYESLLRVSQTTIMASSFIGLSSDNIIYSSIGGLSLLLLPIPYTTRLPCKVTTEDKKETVKSTEYYLYKLSEQEAYNIRKSSRKLYGLVGGFSSLYSLVGYTLIKEDSKKSWLLALSALPALFWTYTYFSTPNDKKPLSIGAVISPKQQFGLQVNYSF